MFPSDHSDGIDDFRRPQTSRERPPSILRDLVHETSSPQAQTPGQQRSNLLPEVRMWVGGCGRNSTRIGSLTDDGTSPSETATSPHDNGVSLLAGFSTTPELDCWRSPQQASGTLSGRPIRICLSRLNAALDSGGSLGRTAASPPTSIPQSSGLLLVGQVARYGIIPAQRLWFPRRHRIMQTSTWKDQGSDP